MYKGKMYADIDGWVIVWLDSLGHWYLVPTSSNGYARQQGQIEWCKRNNRKPEYGDYAFSSRFSTAPLIDITITETGEIIRAS